MSNLHLRFPTRPSSQRGRDDATLTRCSHDAQRRGSEPISSSGPSVDELDKNEASRPPEGDKVEKALEEVAVDPNIVSGAAAVNPSAVPPGVVVGSAQSSRPLKVDEVDPLRGLALEKVGDLWKKSTDAVQPSSTNAQGDIVLYRAWRAWEIVLWPTERFRKDLYSPFHYAFVGSGVALGWSGLSVYMKLIWAEDNSAWTCCGYENDRIVPRVFVTLCLVLSLVSAVIFTVMGIALPHYPRSRTLFEGICLLSVDLAIIFAALYGNVLL